MNKGVEDQLIYGGIMQQTFDIKSTLLDEVIKINSALYTLEDHVSRTFNHGDDKGTIG